MIKELICRYVTLWNKTHKIQVVAFIMKYFNSLSWLPANVGSAIWSLFTGTFHDGGNHVTFSEDSAEAAPSVEYMIMMNKRCCTPPPTHIYKYGVESPPYNPPWTPPYPSSAAPILDSAVLPYLPHLNVVGRMPLPPGLPASSDESTYLSSTWTKTSGKKGCQESVMDNNIVIVELRYHTYYEYCNLTSKQKRVLYHWRANQRAEGKLPRSIMSSKKREQKSHCSRYKKRFKLSHNQDVTCSLSHCNSPDS